MRISRDYLLRLNQCQKILPRSKLTRNPRTIWRVRSRIEAVESKNHKKKSQLTELFLFMFLSMEREILKCYWVYNSNNDGGDPDMKILLTSNLVTEWVANLLPIMSHWRDTMVVAEGWTVWLPVLSDLGSTVYTVYYNDNVVKYQKFPPVMSPWAPVSYGSNRKRRYKEVECWFDSASIGFLTEARQKFDSRNIILSLEVNSMLSEAKKQVIGTGFNIQHVEVLPQKRSGWFIIMTCILITNALMHQKDNWQMWYTCCKVSRIYGEDSWIR